MFSIGNNTFLKWFERESWVFISATGLGKTSHFFPYEGYYSPFHRGCPRGFGEQGNMNIYSKWTKDISTLKEDETLKGNLGNSGIYLKREQERKSELFNRVMEHADPPSGGSPFDSGRKEKTGPGRSKPNWANTRLARSLISVFDFSVRF